MKRNVFALTLALTALAATSAMAQSDLGIKNLGVAAGYVSPENLDGVFSFGVFADHGTIAPRWGLESRIDYWGWSQEAFGAKTSVSDVAIGARTKYYFEVANPKFRPYAGAGLGMHFISSKVDIPASGGFPALSASDSQTKLGVDLGGGVSMPISPRSDLLGELWYGIISDVSQFSMRVGMSYKLGS
jgi:Outer membrane protein beta-barrel domain